ncbi:hypothetical protein [Halobacteriovorax sp.]|uniref:hypothetical protein n=1 Tax=Halobacteriovorax sp. TaxID=2020862 RepID=UPI003AF30443
MKSSKQNRYIVGPILLILVNTFTLASDTYKNMLESELKSFTTDTEEISYRTTFTPRYVLKYHERVKIVEEYRELERTLTSRDHEIEQIRKYVKKKNYLKALKAIDYKIQKYNTAINLMNYLMMSGDNFIAALSDDFEDINYDSKAFEKLFKSVKKQMQYNSRYYKQRRNDRHSHTGFDKYELRNLRNPTIFDFNELKDEINSLAKNTKDKEIVEKIFDGIEEFQGEIKAFKTLKKETEWNAGRYTIFYGIKEFILKSLSYVALPMKHAIKEEELQKVSDREFQPGDIGAIQRYGKLSNLVFKGNWTHGLIYIGEYSKFSNYFNADEETNELYAQKCIDQGLNCKNYLSYLHAKFPDSMKEYKKSEEDGNPYVTLEGLKPGVVFMELGPSMAWDNLVILRPNLKKKDKALALERTFSSIGKKYDYSFNGNSYSRFVCTELIQYSYESNPHEDKEGIDWDVNIVMGRPAMYGFDLVQTFINQEEDKNRPKQLSLVLFMKGLKKKEIKRSLKEPEFGTAKRGTIKELKDTL